MSVQQAQSDEDWAEGFCDKHIPGPYAEAMTNLVWRLTENRMVGMYPPPLRAIPLDAEIKWGNAVIMLDVDGSSGDKTLELDMAQVMADAYDIFKARQAKYGPGNIAAFGEVGCVVRATDKLARLRNLYVNGAGGQSADETAEDTWYDLANYALIGLLCHRGKWPGWTPTQRSLAGGPATAPLDPPPAGGC